MISHPGIDPTYKSPVKCLPFNTKYSGIKMQISLQAAIQLTIVDHGEVLA
jgi:hypothetical protein